MALRTGCLGVALIGILAIPSGAVARADQVPVARCADDSASPGWLARINSVRCAAGVAPVVVNDDWVDGLRAHLNYLARTPARLMTGAYASAHTENPASPWQTSEGAAAGESADLTDGSASDLDAIDLWLAAPFHAVGLLRPQLTRVAFYRDSDSGAAGLDVIRGIDSSLPEATAPVTFPGPGSTTAMSAFRGESPTPLESCGYTSAALPIVAMLPGAPPDDLTASIERPNGRVTSATREVCIVDAHTYRSSDAVYGPTGAAILAGDNAVFILARQAFTPGPYTVTLTGTGLSWSWSFRESGLMTARLKTGFTTPTTTAGHRVVLTGAVTPVGAATTVTVSRWFAGSWHQLRTAAIDRGGRFSIALTAPRAVGRYSYRVATRAARGFAGANVRCTLTVSASAR